MTGIDTVIAAFRRLAEANRTASEKTSYAQAQRLGMAFAYFTAVNILEGKTSVRLGLKSPPFVYYDKATGNIEESET